MKRKAKEKEEEKKTIRKMTISTAVQRKYFFFLNIIHVIEAQHMDMNGDGEKSFRTWQIHAHEN